MQDLILEQHRANSAAVVAQKSNIANHSEQTRLLSPRNLESLGQASNPRVSDQMSRSDISLTRVSSSKEITDQTLIEEEMRRIQKSTPRNVTQKTSSFQDYSEPSPITRQVYYINPALGGNDANGSRVEKKFEHESGIKGLSSNLNLVNPSSSIQKPPKGPGTIG